MTAILSDIHKAGIRLSLDGHRLRVDAPAGLIDDRWRAWFAEHKPALMAALRDPPTVAGITPDDLPPDVREAYEERAAIFEIDGGADGAEADPQALREIVGRVTSTDRSELVEYESNYAPQVEPLPGTSACKRCGALVAWGQVHVEFGTHEGPKRFPMDRDWCRHECRSR